MNRTGHVSGWDFLTLLLWSLFFAAGLVPEPVFTLLRYLANVPAHNAFVNSSAVITFAFAIYFGLFVRRRCLASGLSFAEAQGRGVQAGLIAMIAFLEVPRQGMYPDGRTLLYLVIRSHEIPDLYLKSVVMAVGAAKLLAWWYLYSLVLRYHAFASRDVFGRMAVFFPSASIVGDGPKPVDSPPARADSPRDAVAPKEE